MEPSVTVVGGGYGGVAVAKALDPVADVVLVEPRDTFVHTVATLRALVDPQWTDQIFLPYRRLLTRGRVVRDTATSVDETGVTLASGARLTPDFVVLATGSGYPFPAKMDAPDSSGATARIRETHAALAPAERVLLLGAGPVGLELAGEIRAAWPEKSITIVDPAPDILSGQFSGELRAELRRQLDEFGIQLLLGTSLREQPPVEFAVAKTFTVLAGDGSELTADIWFRCYGVVPATGYLSGALAAARRPDGHVEVTGQLRLPGQHNVFAIGDLTALPEAKMARAAAQHAAVVAANITALANGGELISYTPPPPGISLPLGPAGGASYSEDRGFLGPEGTAEAKGRHLRLDAYRELLGLTGNS
ncbi:FAD-dependent oxidoreductase [Amycolatopsis sp. GM8]|uniref:FAD-dependent oxidoreductase n=1 Tax=Amycolatopsis sp. GM8 TaxID=2896530 RepID=UPI001F375F11|nr:FAD-dependent oxidoreductase [Amycolatopsis sp. GM8]